MKRLLILLSLLVIPSLSGNVFAGNVYPFRIINGNTTGEVDETQFSASDIALSLTNLPGGGRRAIISVIGGGGSNNAIFVSGNGVQFVPDGVGTNALAVDPSIVMTNGGFLIISGTSTSAVANGGSITIAAGSGGGVTNLLDTAGGTYGLVGHTNQPTLLVKGLTNQTPALITITDFGTMLGFSVATQGGFGLTNGWTTNGLPWTVSDTFGFSNASSVVSLAFTNLGGVPTIYLVPDSTLARTGQSQTWSAPQTFNSSAPLTLSGGVWVESSMTVSDSLSVVTNLTVGGSLSVGGNGTITGHLNVGSLTGSVDGGNITGNQTVTTNVLAAFGSNTGTIGSAGQFLVVHLNSAGIPDGWSTVTGSSLATSTNSISAVQLAGSWNNGIIAWSATNFSVATINGTTVTVGFASAPLENITVLNGTTNYTLHGSSLTISNLLTVFGVTLTNSGGSRIDLGGSISMLSNSAGGVMQFNGTASGNTTQLWNGANMNVLAIPNGGQTFKIVPNGTINGVQSEIDILPQDGSNQGYIYFTRNGNKNGAMFIAWNDQGGGNSFIGHIPNGNANGDKRHLNISSSTSAGGLIVANQDGNTTSTTGYQFYENDSRFPRILFTNNKAQSDTNTPALHETYASFGNWTNQLGKLEGGAAIIIGSNENWLVACGRAIGSVSGTKDKEYPTNRFSGFLAGNLSSAQSNQTFMVVRDQTNGLWCIGVDTNGVLGAYRTNDLSTTVLTY